MRPAEAVPCLVVSGDPELLLGLGVPMLELVVTEWPVDPNAELVQYAEAWARKIQFNTPVETVREVAKRPHTNPMVTVAIRSDGSVESVTFVLSSGVAEVDEAIRRIIEGQTPYRTFSPGLAREYDVVEIRRTWYFDDGVRLY